VVPSLAIFPVSVETDFYDCYRERCGVATKQGTPRRVLEAKRALAALLGCAWAYRRLEETLADLEYLTFPAQPMVPEAPAVESSHPASA
jgi:uncharacterized membrane protein